MQQKHWNKWRIQFRNMHKVLVLQNVKFMRLLSFLHKSANSYASTRIYFNTIFRLYFDSGTIYKATWFLMHDNFHNSCWNGNGRICSCVCARVCVLLNKCQLNNNRWPKVRSHFSGWEISCHQISSFLYLFQSNSFKCANGANRFSESDDGDWNAFEFKMLFRF